MESLVENTMSDCGWVEVKSKNRLKNSKVNEEAKIIENVGKKKKKKGAAKSRSPVPLKKEKDEVELEERSTKSEVKHVPSKVIPVSTLKSLISSRKPPISKEELKLVLLNLHRIVSIFDVDGSPIPSKGIKNLGYTCFAAATIQALLTCRVFVRVMIELFQIHSKKNDIYESCKMSAALAEYFDLLLHPSPLAIEKPPFVDPVDFMVTVVDLIPSYKAGMQEDAQEFLNALLNRMHDELKIAPISSATSTSSRGEEWFEKGGKKNRHAVVTLQVTEESPITKLFGGEFRSEYKAKGSTMSVTFEPYLTIALDISDDSIDSLEKSLHSFCTLQSVVLNDGVSVSRKQCFFNTIPETLIFQLKRFVFNRRYFFDCNSIRNFAVSGVWNFTTSIDKKN
jgi:ubiquitin C-terminal hydrolase